MVYPFILRRTKDQVAADLPPRSEELLTCEMEPPQRKLYNKQRDYYRALFLANLNRERWHEQCAHENPGGIAATAPDL